MAFRGAIDASAVNSLAVSDDACHIRCVLWLNAATRPCLRLDLGTGFSLKKLQLFSAYRNDFIVRIETHTTNRLNESLRHAGKCTRIKNARFKNTFRTCKRKTT